jgi:hypothetical protein
MHRNTRAATEIAAVAATLIKIPLGIEIDAVTTEADADPRASVIAETNIILYVFVLMVLLQTITDAATTC